MKSLNQFLQEKLVDKRVYNYQPKTKEELQEIIKQRIAKEGNKANLNDIDVSHITDTSSLFIKLNKFNGDISKWDVSNVERMDRMFDKSKFDGDINRWDVSNVTDMSLMFYRSPLEGKEPSWYRG